MTGYIILKGGHSVYETANWNATGLSMELQQHGLNVSLPGIDPIEPIILGEIEIHPIDDAFPAPPDGKVVASRAVVKQGDRYVAVYTYADRPPMTANEARDELVVLDGQFQPRWLEDAVAGNPPSASFLAWKARKDELRAIVAAG